jgi:RNA polymerase sigma-70 factor, ECF subfamily
VNPAEARAAAEHAARASYGRLLALLAARTGDLALAEDALAAAFEQALTTWPAAGVPENPEGWLLTVAHNRQRDTWKSSAHRTTAPLEAATDRGHDVVNPFDALDIDAIGEKRLELLFVCAHPAIDPAVRTPLMLQTVLGIDSAHIATAFAVPPAAMAQRLVRAKRRIKEARIPFVVPGRSVMPERLPAVLEAIYGAYSTTVTGPSDDGDDLAGEAHYLAVTLAALLPGEPEAWGLAALITLSLARARGWSGSFVPLDEQDAATWDAGLIAEGEAYLRRATPPGLPGRFQLEAAIQAVHCDRARTRRTDWAALRTLYAALLTVAPSLGARVALAAVVGRIDSPATGLEALENIDAGPSTIERFQPYHAARADLLARAGRMNEAAAAFRTAASLTSQPSVREYLLRRSRS